MQAAHDGPIIFRCGHYVAPGVGQCVLGSHICKCATRGSEADQEDQASMVPDLTHAACSFSICLSKHGTSLLYCFRSSSLHRDLYSEP